MSKIIKILLFLCLTLNLSASDNIFENSTKLKANGKNVMLFFGTKTCPYCEILKKDFKEDGAINKILKEEFNVYYIPLDDSIEYEMGDKNPPKIIPTASLKMAFAVKATPQIVMFDENWNKIIQLPGYTDRNQMKIFLDYLVKDIYKNKELLPYLQTKGLIN